MFNLDLSIEGFTEIKDDRMKGIVDQAIQDAAVVVRRTLASREFSPVGDRNQKDSKHRKKKYPRFINRWSAVERYEGGYSFANPASYAQILEYGGYPGVGPRTTPATHALAGGGGIFSKQTVDGGRGGIIGRFLADEERTQYIADQVAKAIREALEELGE